MVKIKPAASRDDLLNRTDTYVATSWADGFIKQIDCYQNGVLIHSSFADYDNQPNFPTQFPNLKQVRGFLFPEIWTSFENTLSIAQETADLLAANAALGNQLSSAIKGAASTIALIQDNQGVINASNTLTVALNAQPTKGNVLFAVIGGYNFTNPIQVNSVSQNNVTWSLLEFGATAFNELRCEVWMGIVNNNADTNVMVAWNEIANAGFMFVLEFVGLKGVVDQIANHLGISINPDTGTTAASTTANEVWIGALLNIDLAIIQMSNPTNGFTMLQGGFDGQSLANCCCVYKIVSAKAAADCSTTGGNAADQWCGCIATVS